MKSLSLLNPFRTTFAALALLLTVAAPAAYAANGSVTAATGGTNLSADLAANGATPAYTTLGTISINEGNGGNRGDIQANQTNATLILAAPSGWQFQAGTGTVSAPSGSITATAINVTTSNITVTFTTNAATNVQDTLTITGIKVRAQNGVLASSPAGNITRSGGSANFSNFDGNNLNSTNFGSLSETAGSAATLTVTPSLTTVTAGTAITATVNLKDQYGNNASGYTGTVHFTSTDGAATLPSNYTFTGADAGVKGFSVTLKTAGSQTVTATDTVTGTLTGTTASITVNPGAASTIVKTSGDAQSATVGGAFGAPFVVTVKDAFNNVLPGASVTFTAPASGASGTFASNSTRTETVTADGSGVATSSAYTTNTSSGSYSVSATSGSASANFTATNNPDVQTGIAVSAPGTSTAGGAFSVTVRGVDQYGNTTPSYTGTVHFTSSDGQAVLPSDPTLVAGTATVSVTLKTSGSQSVTATDIATPAYTATASVTVSAGSATHYAITAPANTTAGNAFNVTVAAKDNFNNTVTAYAGTVHFSSNDGQAILPANSTLTSGTGTFSVTLKTAGARTVVATDTVTASITATANVTVSVGPLTSFAVTAPASSTAGSAFSATVTAKDAYNNTVTNYAGTVHFTSNDAQAVLPSDSTLTLGTGTFSVTLKTSGARTVVATDTVTASVTGTASVTVNATTATKLAFTTQPGSATAGLVFGQQPVVKTQDAFGNDSTVGLNNNVTLTITLSTGTGPLQGTASGNIGNNGGAGTLTFTNLRIDNSADTKQLTAAASGFTSAVSNSFTVSPAATSTFTVTAPASATAGSAFSATVTAKDAFGNTTPAYGGTVHFTSNDGQAVLPVDSTLASGTGTFSVTLKTAGARTVVATDTVSGSITGTANVTVNPAAAASLVLTGVPASTTAGSAFTVTVTAKDAFNNTATSYAGTVHFTSSDGAATLPANSTLVSGTKTFSVTLKTAGSQSVTVTDTVNGALTSTQNSTVSAAATSTFAVTGPGTATAGSAFSVTVTAKDSFGNTTPSYAGTVHFTSNDGAAVLPSNSTLTLGAATFSVTLKTSGARTVVATDTVTASINGTLNVTVSADVAHHFAVSAPATATAGTPVSVTVTAQDQFNNTATAYAGTVTFSSGDAQAVVPGNSTLTSGTGTFSVTFKTAGSQYINAADTVTSSLTGTALVTVNPAAATKLAFSTQPGNATAGAIFGTQPVIKTRDAFDNDSTVGLAHNQTLTITLTTGTGPLQGTTSGNSLNIGQNGGNGTFTTTDLRIDNASDAKQITVASSGFTSATSNAFTVSPAATSTFAVTAPASATAGSAFSATVTARDAFANTTPAYSGTVHFTSNDGQAILPANSTLTSGSGTFSVTLKTAGPHTVVATDTLAPGINGSTSVNVLAGAPALVTKTAGDAQTGAAGSSRTATVNVTDAFGNNVPSTNVSFVITAGGGTANGSSSANVSTNASGNASVTWTFGPAAGPNTMSATAGAASATFTGTGTCTYTSKTSGLWSNGTTWVGQCVPTISDAVTIASGHTVSVTSNAQAASVTFAAASADSNLNLASGITLDVNGAVFLTTPAANQTAETLAVGAGTLNAASITLNASGGQKETDLTVTTGTINVTGDVSFPGNAPTQKLTSTGAAHINIGGNFNAGGTLTLDPTTVLTFNGTGAQSIGSYNPNNAFPITIVNKTSGTVTELGSLGIAGNFTITAGTFDTGNNTLRLLANFTNNGTFTSAGTVLFNGTSAQSFGGSGSETFNGMTMNNTAGLTINKDVTASGILTLTLGNISTGANTLSISSTGSVSRTSGHVIGNLRKSYTAAGSKTFEVGTANGYSPATVNASAGNFPANITVRATQGAHPNAPSVSTLQRYWTVSCANDVAFDLTLNYLAGDVVGNELLYKFAGFANAAWTYPATGSVDTVNHIGSATGLSQFGDFTLTENATNLAITAVNGGVNPIAGSPFSVTVAATSGDGQPAVVVQNTTVQLSLGNGTGTLGGTLTGMINAGTSSVVISGVTYTKAEGNVILNVTATAGDPLAAGASAPFVVDPGATHHFAVSAPASTAAGSPTSFTVLAQDAFNNTTPAYSGTVTFTSSDSGAVLPAPATLTNGAGTFSITFHNAGTQSITATDGSITGTTSISVTAGPTDHFVLTAPAATQSGAPVSVTVTAFDLFGNATPTYTGTVHFTSNDGSATLPANYAFTGADAGTHSFSATLATVGTGSVTATDTVTSSITGSVSLTVTSAPVVTNIDLVTNITGTANTLPGTNATYTITVRNNGSASAPNVNITLASPAGWTPSVSGGCSSFPCNYGTLNAGATATISVTLAVPFGAGNVTPYNVTASASTSGVESTTANNTSTVQTTIPIVDCPTQVTTMIPFANSTDVALNVTLSWNAANADSYQVYLGKAGGGCSTLVATTATNHYTAHLQSGQNYEWHVVALRAGCAPVSSSCIRFSTATTCESVEPTIRALAEVTSGSHYHVSWTDLGASQYELQESADEAFTAPVSSRTATLTQTFTHEVTAPTPFYYRVRAVTSTCAGLTPNFSPVVRVIVQPHGNPNSSEFDLVVESGSTDSIPQSLHFNGNGAGASSLNAAAAGDFVATSDQPWLVVFPSSGSIPPAGTDVMMTAIASGLPAGTQTAMIRLASSNGTPIQTIKLALHVAEPVISGGKDIPPSNASIIPGVAHAAGLNSKWQSDVRIYNPGSKAAKYALLFTPAAQDGTLNGRRVDLNIASHATVALDDVVRHEFGYGVMNESAAGALEIRPLDAAEKAIVTSRTYNVASNGTYGQYIPAFAASQFAKMGDVMSLQQVAQNDSYRTNIGFVDASGLGARLNVRVYDGSGTQLTAFDTQLKPFEQTQIDSLLASKKITANDARVEVEVMSTDSKVLSYASVVDNKTSDPLLVTPAIPTRVSETRYVIPGVADLTNLTNAWRSDVRIYNSSRASVNATVTFFPSAGDPIAKQISLAPGEVKAYDGVLPALFGVTNNGGALHVTTATQSSLVVTARTYDAHGNGTYGQFIPALTSADGTSLGARPLEILSVEQSDLYRANIGVLEIAGKSADVTITVTLPDGRTATRAASLAPYQFVQFTSLVKSLGFDSATNVRVTIAVNAGQGRVAGYASVVDNRTQDPTYIPAQ